MSKENQSGGSGVKKSERKLLNLFAGGAFPRQESALSVVDEPLLLEAGEMQNTLAWPIQFYQDDALPGT